ncbi:MAG: tRNA dihydrouridine synthase DusB [Pseudobdellovibrionaceae bacterium]
MDPVQALKQNPFVLAPMAGITDHAFRTFMKARKAGVVVTELISATGIEYKSDRTLKLMSFDESQRPVGIQLFGEDPEIMAKSAQFAEEKGADFIDLNFGCPVPKVTKKGAGSAILKDLPHMITMISTIKKAIRIPLTIKIRTGWDQGTRNADEVVKIAFDEGVSWVAIHGRTRAQGYSGLADWDYIAEVKSKSKVPILGNGDILTAEQAVERLRQSGCDGVLIGRGCLKNPYIFADALALWQGENLDSTLERDYVNLYQQLHEVLLAHCDERILQIQLKKFAAWFATGYPGSAAFRKSIFQAKNTEEILDSSLNFFNGIQTIPQEDTSKDAFLMGGHG